MRRPDVLSRVSATLTQWDDVIEVKVGTVRNVIAAYVADHAELSEDRGVVDIRWNSAVLACPATTHKLSVDKRVCQPSRLAKFRRSILMCCGVDESARIQSLAVRLTVPAVVLATRLAVSGGGDNVGGQRYFGLVNMQGTICARLFDQVLAVPDVVVVVPAGFACAITLCGRSFAFDRLARRLVHVRLQSSRTTPPADSPLRGGTALILSIFLQQVVEVSKGDRLHRHQVGRDRLERAWHSWHRVQVRLLRVHVGEQPREVGDRVHDVGRLLSGAVPPERGLEPFTGQGRVRRQPLDVARYPATAPLARTPADLTKVRAIEPGE